MINYLSIFINILIDKIDLSQELLLKISHGAGLVLAPVVRTNKQNYFRNTEEVRRGYKKSIAG